MRKKKVIGKRDLKRAWKEGGYNYSGAARQLGVARNTFKNLWDETGYDIPKPAKKTRTKSTRQKRTTPKPTPSKFKDPKVEKIYKDYQCASALKKNIVIEHIQHIEQLRIRIKSMEQEVADAKVKLEKSEKTLYNLKLGGL